MVLKCISHSIHQVHRQAAVCYQSYILEMVLQDLGSHRSVVKDSCLLECYTTSTHKYLPTF